ncbi:MAG: hypothetical protein QME21_02630 [Anaerolineales bacterium]|nr:hypothetical protein [Anaerolineales bacterium]
MFLTGTLLLSLNFVRIFGFAISDWFYLGALVLALFETLLFDRKNIICWTRNRFYWPAGLILLGALISSFFTRYLEIALIEILQQLFVITLFISLIWVMVRRGRTNTVIQAFIMSGVFTALIVSIDYFAGTNFGPILSGTPDVKLWGRYAGATGHPNKLGYFLAITSILNIIYVIKSVSRKKRFYSIFWFLTLLIQLFGLYISGSMTAYLGFVCGLVFLTVSSKYIRIKLLRLSIVVIIISASLMSIFSLLGLQPISISVAAVQEGQLALNTIERVKTTTARSRWILYD